MGSESHGLPASLLDLTDERWRIPGGGRAESLSLPQAAAIMMYECTRKTSSLLTGSALPQGAYHDNCLGTLPKKPQVLQYTRLLRFQRPEPFRRLRGTRHGSCLRGLGSSILNSLRTDQYEVDAMEGFIQVMTATDKREDAEHIARSLVEMRLAGCVQIVGPVTSIYRWKGKIETAGEWLCLIKSRARSAMGRSNRRSAPSIPTRRRRSSPCPSRPEAATTSSGSGAS